MTLRVCVVLGNGPAPGAGERRFLATLEGDSRFDLSCVASAPKPSDLPKAVRRVLDLERRVFALPDTAPRLTHTVVSLTQAMQGAYDVVIDFTNCADAAGLTRVSKQGVWRLSSFEDDAGLAEVRDHAPATFVTLSREMPGGSPEPISEAAYDTKFLASRGAAYVREKSVQMLIQALARLHTEGHLRGVSQVTDAGRPFTTRDLPVYLARTTSDLFARSVRQVQARLGRRPGMFYLSVGQGDRQTFDPSKGINLMPPGRTYWADPFFIEHDSKTYIFYEEFDYATRHGHISVGRLDGDAFTPLGPVLSRPYHMSFPFVFHWRDQILMIPETNNSGQVEVWQATDFPTKFELVSTALHGIRAADTVVFERDNQWWLLTNICNDSFGDFSTELHLFAVDSPLLNEVRPHPLNPVVIDARTARGGGRVFSQNGRLYRASQDNTHKIYGYGLNLMEITELSETSYREKPVRKITPDFAPGIMGCHHLDSTGGRWVMDVRRRFFGVSPLWLR